MSTVRKPKVDNPQNASLLKSEAISSIGDLVNAYVAKIESSGYKGMERVLMLLLLAEAMSDFIEGFCKTTKLSIENDERVSHMLKDAAPGDCSQVSFGSLAYNLSVARPPQICDSKVIINQLRTKYGVKITRELVDEIVALATKDGTPRKTRKVVIL